MSQRARRRQKLREAVEFEEDVPRCGNCQCFKPAGFILINSKPRKYEASCRVHTNIRPQPNSVCNTWTGRDGSTLE